MNNEHSIDKLSFVQRHAGVLVTLALIIGLVAGAKSDVLLRTVGPVFGMKPASSIDYTSVDELYKTLQQNYDGELTQTAITEGLKRGLVSATDDPYTTYMDAKEASEFQKSLSGNIGGGVGAEVGVRGGQPTILRVLPGNPAEKAGVLAGDVVVGVNDVSVKGLSLDKTIEKIRGEIGTTVKLNVMRGADMKEFTITRAEIVSKSVEYRVEQGVGIIRMIRFDDKTGALAREAAEDLKRQGVKSVVLDLRDNLGGYVTAAQEAAGIWLGKDKLLVSERSMHKPTQTLNASGDAILGDMKTVVLVNGASASASEIVAGALSEYKKATLVGEKTFGKGSVQKVVDLADEAILKVTIAKWYTPNGKNINKEGIQPDKKVELSRTDLDAGRDTQLQAAFEVLK